MEADAALGAVTPEESSSPSTEELPLPVFLHRHRRGLHRSLRMTSPPTRREPAEAGTPRSWRTASGGTEREDSRPDGDSSNHSQEDDPWLRDDPWQRGQENYEPKYDNWSSPSSSMSASQRGASDGSWQWVRGDERHDTRQVYWADGVAMGRFSWRFS